MEKLHYPMASCPVRGTWIEMQCSCSANPRRNCRAPYGARGLKFFSEPPVVPGTLSCPVRGTWIEILPKSRGAVKIMSCPVRGTWIEICPCRRPASRPRWSRPVRGAWIEIRPGHTGSCCSCRRAPYGARGLKFQCLVALLLVLRRAPYGGKS